MHVIKARNVHAALHRALHELQEYGVRRESRNGPVLMFSEPVTTVYACPEERVVFWPERDANPFFHFYESLWMLAGRNDVSSLTRYVPRMKDFSDDGKVFHGAYGYRWRDHFEYDQLEEIIERLRKNPDDRRQVLAMWDAEADGLHQDGMKDLPCNTQAMFSINHCGNLDMMVTNRSNDIILGAYGANAVHFSYLQEYVARFVGVPVGTYRQVSNNFHAYLNKDYHKLEPLIGRPVTDPYGDGISHFPLVNRTSQADWDSMLDIFLDQGEQAGMDLFFRKVAGPIVKAHALYKSSKDINRFNAVHALLVQCRDTAWRLACQQWMQRREVRERRTADDGPVEE
jgi:thymidylate synthase